MVQVVPTIDALNPRREEILAIARRRHAARVRVYGWVARGEAGPSSDVDLLVDFGAQASLVDQVGLTQDPLVDSELLAGQHANAETFLGREQPGVAAEVDFGLLVVAADEKASELRMVDHELDSQTGVEERLLGDRTSRSTATALGPRSRGRGCGGRRRPE